MKNRFIILCTMFMMLSSCNDWLDVRPETEKKSEELFATYKGFRDALTGCYMTMADRNIYGERLTMSNIESLANLWFIRTDAIRYDDVALTAHDYTGDYAKDAIKSIYSSLFYTIAQANMIIKYADKHSHVFDNERTKAIIQGEAYAIRAYCQLDVLRLFGQLPQDESAKVELPYSETTGIDEIPTYYAFNQYVVKLENDINRALTLLKDNDPLFQYTYEQLNNSKTELDEDYIRYRQSRLNYWAVKALQARMYLYLGKKEQAYNAAKEIISAKGADGKPVIRLSGDDDIKNTFYALPTECLFYLSKFNLLSYTTELLIGGGEKQFFTQRLAISIDMLSQLYVGQSTSSHNRYVNLWNKKVTNEYGQAFVATKKYYFKEDAENLLEKRQIIPMLRLSEIYLIAIETTTDLSEANQWYTDYMASHNVALTEPQFTSLQDIQDEMINEYRREFFAEGQMFYTYKRVGATDMLWRKTAVEMSEYVLPLPESEYNPNKTKQKAYE